jgi:8-amino-7-oxononanoate synthase
MCLYSLDNLKGLGLYREITDRDALQGRVIRIAGRDLINFSSNDYLGLASDPEIGEYACAKIRSHGFGAGASRLLSGGTVLHEELERSLALLKGTQQAVVFNSGYAANTGAIPALAGEDDVIFSDELNHASIIDGCRLSRARKVIFRHGDVEELRSLVKKNHGVHRIIITESVFSMDGDVSPIREIYELCGEEDALFYLDDAHGTGILGKGKGALAHFGLNAEHFVVQMGTLSKALGSYGAFVAASGTLTEYLINTARSLIYSTALPPVVVAGAVKAVEKLVSSPELVERLWGNALKMHRGLDDLGINKGRSTTQIIPIIFDSPGDAEALSRYLLDRGVYAPLIRPPTVEKPRLRVSVTASHSDADIDTFLGFVREFLDGER